MPPQQNALFNFIDSPTNSVIAPMPNMLPIAANQIQTQNKNYDLGQQAYNIYQDNITKSKPAFQDKGSQSLYNQLNQTWGQVHDSINNVATGAMDFSNFRYRIPKFSSKINNISSFLIGNNQSLSNAQKLVQDPKNKNQFANLDLNNEINNYQVNFDKDGNPINSFNPNIRTTKVITSSDLANTASAAMKSRTLSNYYYSPDGKTPLFADQQTGLYKDAQGNTYKNAIVLTKDGPNTKTSNISVNTNSDGGKQYYSPDGKTPLFADQQTGLYKDAQGNTYKNAIVLTKDGPNTKTSNISVNTNSDGGKQYIVTDSNGNSYISNGIADVDIANAIQSEYASNPQYALDAQYMQKLNLVKDQNDYLNKAILDGIAKYAYNNTLISTNSGQNIKPIGGADNPKNPTNLYNTLSGASSGSNMKIATDLSNEADPSDAQQSINNIYQGIGSGDIGLSPFIQKDNNNNILTDSRGLPLLTNGLTIGNDGKINADNVTDNNVKANIQQIQNKVYDYMNTIQSYNNKKSYYNNILQTALAETLPNNANTASDYNAIKNYIDQNKDKSFDEIIDGLRGLVNNKDIVNNIENKSNQLLKNNNDVSSKNVYFPLVPGKDNKKLLGSISYIINNFTPESNFQINKVDEDTPRTANNDELNLIKNSLSDINTWGTGSDKTQVTKQISIGIDGSIILNLGPKGQFTIVPKKDSSLPDDMLTYIKNNTSQENFEKVLGGNWVTQQIKSNRILPGVTATYKIPNKNAYINIETALRNDADKEYTYNVSFTKTPNSKDIITDNNNNKGNYNNISLEDLIKILNSNNLDMNKFEYQMGNYSNIENRIRSYKQPSRKYNDMMNEFNSNELYF